MNYYTLKQIILGLRDEYKKNQSLLSELKQYITLKKDERIQDFGFYPYNYHQDKYIELVIEEKLTLIEKLLNHIYRTIVKGEEKVITPVSHELSGEKRYVVLPKDVRLGLDDDRLNEFYSNVDKILGSEFIQKIANGKATLPNAKADIKIFPGGISSYNNYLFELYPPTGIKYNAADDELIVTAYEDPVFSEHLDNILNIRVPKDKFNKEQRYIIDNNPNTEMNVVFHGNTATRVPQYFDIEEENSNTIAFVRNKKK